MGVVTGIKEGLVETTTTKKIAALYNVEGSELFVVRKMLEVMKYMSPAWKGSQTYFLRYPLPDTIAELESVYLAAHYLYKLPEDYVAIFVELEALRQECLGTGMKYKARLLGTRMIRAARIIEKAIGLLPSKLDCPETMLICQPIHDCKLHPVCSRNNRISNTANLLIEIGRTLSELDVDEDMIAKLQEAAKLLKGINIPNPFNSEVWKEE